MYGCESWTIKKVECWRIDAFELQCWRRLLKISWTAKRSIWKEINPEYSLERLMLKLKLHYFGHLIRRADSLEKTLMLGKIEGKRRRGWQRLRWLHGITDSVDIEFEQTPGGSEEQGSLVCCGSRVPNQTWLSHWTATDSHSRMIQALPVKCIRRST